MKTEKPFQITIDKKTGVIDYFTEKKETKYQDMMGLFKHNDADIPSDQLIYTVFLRSVPQVHGELLQCTTVIEPGNIGGEFFMTKGHIHQDQTCCEIYHGISGKGLLLLQRDSDYQYFFLTPGSSVYIPGTWAHRTINVGSEPFIFYSIWPSTSGYNYEKIKEKGFACRIMQAVSSADGFEVLISK